MSNILQQVPANVNLYYHNMLVDDTTTISFGEVSLGETVQVPLTIRNEEPSAITKLQGVVDTDFSVTHFPDALLSGESRQFFLNYTPSRVDLLGVNKSVVKNSEGKLVVQVKKELKGILQISGELIRVRDVTQ